MHYKNGREAKSGDRIINLGTGLSGILHSTVATNTSCNGRMAVVTFNDPYVTISECLCLDDVIAANILDSSVPNDDKGTPSSSS